MIEILSDTNKRTKDRCVISLCKCYCGNLFETPKNTVNKKVKSCGCSRIKNLVGKKFGLILVVSITNDRSIYNNSVIWKCKCDCGNEIFLSTSQLNHPNRISCGCYKENIINSCKNRAGKKHHWYNTNLRDEDRIRKRIGQTTFSKNVFQRDNYTCDICNKRGGNLIAHHLNSYDWFIDGRQDINNGITLCVFCHKKFHENYGYGKNTITQYKEFKALKNVNMQL